MSPPPSASTAAVTSPSVGRMRYGEFVALVSALGAMTAAGIDVMLPAFDEMRVAFGLDPDSTRLATALTTYFAGIGIGQLLWGPLGDRFGRKPTLYAGLVLYAAGALGSMWSPSLPALFAFRFAWGLGAAACVVVSVAIVRDRFSGNAMARVMVLVQTVFMLGPVFSPVIGHIIVELTGWPWVFGFCGLLAVAMLGWMFRLDETLDPDDRRPLSAAGTVEGFTAVVSTRPTLLYGLVRAFSMGAFFIYLGSAELIISEVYGRAAQFAWYFGAMGAVMGATSFVMSKLVDRIGTRQVLVGALAAFAGSSAVLLVVSVAGSGQPPFWMWFGVVVVANSASISINPTSNTLAMEPMGAQAGTASGVLGAAALGGGALLAAPFTAAITDSVTPLAVGYLAYGLIGLVLVLPTRVSASEAAGTTAEATAAHE